MYLCYIISNNSSRTYIGYTNDFKKRIRQHNGEISGGAKYTTAHMCNDGWTPILLISGIENKHNALSLEWRMKRSKNMLGKLKPNYGINIRIKNVFEIIKDDIITSKSSKITEIGEITLIVNNDYNELVLTILKSVFKNSQDIKSEKEIENIKLKDNIKIKCLECNDIKKIQLSNTSNNSNIIDDDGLSNLSQ